MPSGLNATEITPPKPVGAVSVPVRRAVRTSHRYTVSDDVLWPPAASVVPSGLNATESTLCSSGPLTAAVWRPAAMFHRWAP